MSTAAFVFPLNVYARVLELTEQRVDYLHYGVFEPSDKIILQAQERASSLLWAQMPMPCRVLEVGIGLGTTLRRLHERGYRAHGITPEAAQVAEAHARHGDTLSLEVISLEELGTERGPWDLLLLQESAQYIAPLALFEAADRLLAGERATILVMDEFALERGSADHSGLHHLGHFVALAERLGWRIAHQQDISAGARPTLDALLRMIHEHRASLINDLGVQPLQLDELGHSLQRYRELYRTGVYGYQLLRLERLRAPASQLVAVNAHNAAAMRRLFEQVFSRPMGEAEWAWKYGSGRGRGVGLQRDGRLVAHYGGVTRPISMFGQPALACQVCDVMVAPEANAALARKGAMYQVAATFLEAEIGWGRPHAVGFGFPNVRALRLAEKLGLYEPVDEMVRLSWPSAVPPRGGDWRWAAEALDCASLQEGSREWAELGRLWRDMAAAFGGSVLGVRDAAWLRHRYGDKPGVQHELLWVRSRLTRRCMGVVVMRRYADTVEIVDLLGPPRYFHLSIRAARRAALAAGTGRVEAWVTASHQHHLVTPGEQAACDKLGILVPANAHSPGPSPASLRDRWFLMAGDTDFR